ncbi:alpha/beta hydrolase [Dietzia sp. NPDC055340]
MRKLWNVLRWPFVFLLVVVLAVVAARVVNHFRYPEPALAYAEPRNPASYPTELPGIEVTPIADGRVRGFHLRPETIRHEGVVLTWGGSEGGPDFEHAELLARAGHEVLSLFYFGQPGQPETLDRVPVETASQAIDWAEANAESADPVTIVGTSKGAELAALLPTYEPRVDNLVLFAPMDHVMQGMDQRNVVSSWTVGGQDVPYVAYADAPGPGPVLRLALASLLGAPIHLRPVFEGALEAPQSGDARIDLTRLPGEMLVFAGGDDQVWPADAAARRIAEDLPESTEVHIYDDAGHVFSVPGAHADGMLSGGSAEANAAALEESNRILVERLADWSR